MTLYGESRVRVVLLCWVFVFSCTSSVFGRVVYVDATADGADDGTNWADAFVELKSALALSDYGDEVWVACGTYRPDYDADSGTHTGDRGASFVINSGVRLYGGFAQGGAEWDDRNPTVWETTLSGDLSGNDVAVVDLAQLPYEPSRAENSYHVVIASGADPNTLMDGLTISGGNANGVMMYEMEGGGIYGFPSTDMAIHQCIIQDNSAENDIVGVVGGGGIEFCNGRISDCVIRRNAAIGPCAQGGGLWECDGVIEDCTFTENLSGKWGAALCGCDGIIRNCVISDNFSEQYGGGLDHCSGEIRDCVISSNRAACGAGVYWCEGSIIGCTISGNVASDRLGGCGGGIADCFGSISKCTIAGNSAMDMYSSGGGLWQCSCVVTDCNITDNWALYRGGGLDAGSPAVFDCVISRNSAGTSGGALSNCDARIERCTISENSAPYGAGFYYCSLTMSSCEVSGNLGMALVSCSGSVHDCRICDNTELAFSGCDNWVSQCVVSGNGGNGFSFHRGRVSNSIISNNRGTDGAGFVYCTGSVSNCIISGNIAYYRGGGAAFCSGPFVNCTIVGNAATWDFSSGGGLDFCTAAITNCIITDNRAVYQPEISDCNVPTFSCIYGTEAGVGCIDEDPLFVQEGFWDANGTTGNLSDDFWVEGDYRLSDDSPCIDAGDPNSDFSAEPMPNGGRINMGAYGNTPEATKSPVHIDLTGNYCVDLRDLSIFAEFWRFGEVTADIDPWMELTFYSLQE